MPRVPTSSHPRVLGRAAVAVCTLVLVAGCGASNGSSGGSSGGSAAGSAATSTATSAMSGRGSSASPATVTIHISSFRFTVPASVAPGATVNVMNMDGDNHTVTADDGTSFDVLATAGTTVTFVAPTKPGSYPFHCVYHANMHGVLVVG